MSDGGRAGGRRAVAWGPAPPGGGDDAKVLAADAKVLAADVGTGTADIFVTLPGEPLENAVRLVVPSRTRAVAREIGAATRAGATVVFSGPVMGGGASGAAMKRHVVAGLRFVAGTSAALTFDDDLDLVRERGVEVVSDEEAAAMAAAAGTSATGAGRGGSTRGGVVAVRSGDLDVVGLRDVLCRLGVDASFDVVCVAVQDHGFNPHESNRVARFAFWEEAVAARRALVDLFYEPPAIPEIFTRLAAAAALAAELGDGVPVLAADTGPAAVYGALPEAVEGSAGAAVLVNVGNGHTVCVVARDGRLVGVYEHHTSALDAPSLERHLRRFIAGDLGSAEVREDGGHGAVLAREALAGFSGPIMVTGPRRDLLRDSGLPLEFAAPYGDMMLTGCYGLLRAARERGLAASLD